MDASPRKSTSFGRLCRILSPKKEAQAQKRCLQVQRQSSSSEIQRVFNYMDENGDGRISAAELQSCFRTLGGELSMADAEAAVQSTDLNGDGVLDLSEFEKLMEREGEGEGEGASGRQEQKNSELREAFGMYVMEGSSYITPASLKRMLTRLGDSSSIEDCRTMIRAFDINGDGVLSFEEFAIMMH